LEQIFIGYLLNIRGDGPTAQQSKLNVFHVAVMKLTVEDPNLQQVWSLEEAGTSQHVVQEMDGAFL